MGYVSTTIYQISRPLDLSLSIVTIKGLGGETWELPRCTLQPA